MHHSDALTALQDPQQPLSREGRRQAASLASKANARGAKPTAIWHSGKLRARQTAEAMLAACNPFASFRVARGLQPDAAADIAAAAVEGVDEDLMIVSHAPLLSALVARLGVVGPFPLHGMVALVRVEPGRYAEEWRAD